VRLAIEARDQWGFLARNGLEGCHDDVLDLIQQDRWRPAQSRLIMQASITLRTSGATR
jgi:hypothetical protein